MQFSKECHKNTVIPVFTIPWQKVIIDLGLNKMYISVERASEEI